MKFKVIDLMEHLVYGHLQQIHLQRPGFFGPPKFKRFAAIQAISRHKYAILRKILDFTSEHKIRI